MAAGIVPQQQLQQQQPPSQLDDDFFMYRFKVEMCTRDENHDWARCPFAHEKEKARRRDPRLFKYASLPCPDTMQGGSCARGDACAYTHSVQEYWLHPDRYKTQMCKNGAHCNRPLCFFAHRADDLRFPEPTTDAMDSGASHVMPEGSALQSPMADLPTPPGLPAPALLAAAAAPMTEFIPQGLLPPVSLASLSGLAGAAAPLGLPNLINSSPAVSMAGGLMCSVPNLPPMQPPCMLQHDQHASAACQLRAYLEQQQLAVVQQRVVLEQQRLALDLWLAQLQQQEATAGAAAAIAALEEAPSPMSVAPRMPSSTSSVSRFSAAGPLWFGDLDAPQTAAHPQLSASAAMFPASAALTSAAPPAVLSGGLLGRWFASTASQPSSPSKLFGAALNPAF